MAQQKTHREVKKPQVSARYLADYMAASEQAKRTIVRGCKYQPIARVVQHNEARVAIAKFILSQNDDVELLRERAQKLRNRLADSVFDRDLFDHNADYIDRYADIFPKVILPNADLLQAGKSTPLTINDVHVTLDIHFRLRRLTRTNKVRIGAGMLRYAKGKALSPEVGEWQSAFIFGYLNQVCLEAAAEPEHNLCMTIDAYSGICYPAPTDSTRRFHNMEAACASIAERWPAIPPPTSAVL